MKIGVRAKFDAARAEFELHAVVLAEALAGLPAALTAIDVTPLTTDVRRVLDQVAYRFMKLQDSLGEKVLPGLLDLAQEPLAPEASFAEKLQRLERLGALTSANTWRTLREVRNALAHEYPENPVLQAAALTRLLQAAAELLCLWDGVESYCVKRLS